jgi:hypothetical protein
MEAELTLNTLSMSSEVVDEELRLRGWCVDTNASRFGPNASTITKVTAAAGTVGDPLLKSRSYLENNRVHQQLRIH